MIRVLGFCVKLVYNLGINVVCSRTGATVIDTGRNEAS